MANQTAALDATILQKWDETIAAGQDAEQTISTNLEATRRIVKSALADGIRRLGYEFGAELGRGGLGVVNLATQQVFDRPVAVKRLLGGSTDREAAMKFFAEALVTAQLEHPNIVPIHDLMANAEGQLQLAMKRVAGLSWRDLLHPRTAEHRAQAEALSLDDHLDILLKVCDAVSFAHGRGILHRDLKPENVMVGAYGEVLVMDWGCAVAFGDHEQHPVVPRVEEITHLAGTPCYMAPEMVLVQVERIAPHSDVYQLGAVLYEVLTLQKPNRGTTVYEVLDDAARGTVVPPVEATPDRGIPEELSDLALMALAKDPAERIGEVAQLAQRVKDYRRHAQAVALEAAARVHLAAAAKHARGAGEALRKAVSAAEQACEIWPGWPTAGQTLLDATLAWAQLHLDAGAPALAVTQSEQAATLAKKLGRGEQAKSANALLAKSRAAVIAHATRQRQLRLARLGLAAAGVVLVIGLVGFLALVSAEQHRTAAALAMAEKALADLNHEHVARGDDQKTSAPALVAQARKAIAGKDLAGAMTALQTAIGFDPTLVEAHQLYANVLAAAKRFTESVAAGQRWQDIAHGDVTPAQLIGLCKIMGGNPNLVTATETQLKLAELFERQQLYILAEVLAISPAKRLELYRKRIDAAWPGVGAGVEMREDGKLVTGGYASQSKGFRERKDVVDLDPIRGMPFAVLDLQASGIRKLDGLAGMPLEDLSIGGTAIIDLSPLRGMALHRLTVVDTKISDLSPLAGMPLNFLWGYNSQISDLSPLKGMPLYDVHLSGCQITDLSALAGSPISNLNIGSGIHDLAPLRGLPLKSLNVAGHGNMELSSLTNAPLEQVSIATTGEIDLAALPTSVTRLELGGALVRPPAGLAHLRPISLRLEQYNNDRTIDLHQCDGSRLESIGIGHCSVLDLSGLSAPRLKYLDINFSGDIDLSPMATSPVKELTVGQCSPVTWRSLAAFRQSPTLAAIIVDGRKFPVAAFWPVYEPLFPPGAGPTKPPTVVGAFAAVKVDTPKPGLSSERYVGITGTVDAMRGQKPVEQSVLAEPRIVDAAETTGWRLTGYLVVPRTGDYALSLSSDDGSRLYLHDKLAIDLDGDHAMATATCQVHLDAGAHPLTILYYNGGMVGGLTVEITGQDLPPQVVPASWLRH